jgi:hypothetical protein
MPDQDQQSRLRHYTASGLEAQTDWQTNQRIAGAAWEKKVNVNDC